MELSRSDECAWHDFDGGIELRVAGHNKGDVMRTHAGEAGPEYAAAILVRDQLHPAAAKIWMRAPGELHQFLTRWRLAAGEHPR